MLEHSRRGWRESHVAVCRTISARSVSDVRPGTCRAFQDWIACGHLPRARSERSFTISAARSLVFNAVLAERVIDRSWDRLRPGDVANLDGTGSIFAVDVPTPQLEERCRALDIHPTGPLWGADSPSSGSEVRNIETGVERRFETVMMALAGAGLTHERRALRLRVADLQAHAAGRRAHARVSSHGRCFCDYRAARVAGRDRGALTMLEIIDHEVAREIRFARPPVNAFNVELLERLNQALDAARADSCRAIVLSGRPGMFTAGLDVPELLTLDRKQMLRAGRSSSVRRHGSRRRQFRWPQQSPAHSPAGGAVLALYCDHRVMAAGKYRIGLNEVQVGLFPGQSSMAHCAAWSAPVLPID